MKPITIYVGEKKQLKISGMKEDISWKSYNKRIVTVSKNGIITGKAYGNTTVIGKTKSNYYKFKVKVNSKYDFSFDENKVILPNDMCFF